MSKKRKKPIKAEAIKHGEEAGLDVFIKKTTPMKKKTRFFKNMKAPKFVEKIKFTYVFIGLAFIISAITVFFGGYINKGYGITEGMVSPRRFTATEDVVNEVATNRLRDEAAERARENVIYKQDSAITRSVINALDIFFNEISLMRIQLIPIPDPTMEEETIPLTVSDLDRSNLNLNISNSLYFSFLVNCPSSVYSYFKDAVYAITEETLENGIREDSLHRIALTVKDEVLRRHEDEWDNIVINTAVSIITEVLKPNMIFDHESMDKAAENAMASVAPVMVFKGQSIVNEYELITPEIYAILESLRLVSQSLFDNILAVTGALLCVITIFTAGVIYLYFIYRKKFSERKNTVLLFTLYTTTIVTAWVLQSTSFVFIPIIIFTILAAILLEPGIAVIFTLCVTIVTAAISMGDMRYIAYFVISGLFSSVVARRVSERSKMLSVMAMLSAFSVVLIFAIYLIVDGNVTQEMLDMAVGAGLYSIFSVIVCVGSLPFFETVFGFVTPMKLIDLANPNNPLLRRLIIEAPGTYHHSLIVANLAETASFDIGANHALARIGGYYHDVGKLNFPHYFVENVTNGVNPHDSMDPYLSAKIILEHVSNGVALANAHKIPRVIRSFIEEHHGASVQKFFYYKAKKLNPDAEVKEEDFKYAYTIPQSRETAVVMLADMSEAAVRSMAPSGKTMKEIEEFVKKLIKTTLDEGRLDNSGLTINDLSVIAAAFMRVFRGMYHERVKYPSPSGDSKAEAEKKTSDTAESEKTKDKGSEETKDKESVSTADDGNKSPTEKEKA